MTLAQSFLKFGMVVHLDITHTKSTKVITKLKHKLLTIVKKFGEVRGWRMERRVKGSVHIKCQGASLKNGCVVVIVGGW